MKLLPLTTLLAFLTLGLAACGGEKDKEALSAPCSKAPTPLRARPADLKSFPPVPGARYVHAEQKGPTSVVTGWLQAAISPAHTRFASALEAASGYQVTKEEQDVADAEVTFAGGRTSGQVKLVQQCKSRTGFTITIRPA